MRRHQLCVFLTGLGLSVSTQLVVIGIVHTLPMYDFSPMLQLLKHPISRTNPTIALSDLLKHRHAKGPLLEIVELCTPRVNLSDQLESPPTLSPSPSCSVLWFGFQS
jgi:hypothetical protein